MGLDAAAQCDTPGASKRPRVGLEWIKRDSDGERIRDDPVAALEAMRGPDDLARFVLAFAQKGNHVCNGAPDMVDELFEDMAQIRRVDCAMRVATQGVSKHLRDAEYPEVPLGVYMRKFARRWFGGVGKKALRWGSRRAAIVAL